MSSLRLRRVSSRSIANTSTSRSTADVKRVSRTCTRQGSLAKFALSQPTPDRTPEPSSRPDAEGSQELSGHANDVRFDFTSLSARFTARELDQMSGRTAGSPSSRKSNKQGSSPSQRSRKSSIVTFSAVRSCSSDSWSIPACLSAPSRAVKRFTSIATGTFMGFIMLSVMGTLLIMLGVQLLTRAVWAECAPGSTCKWAKTHEEILADVVYSRVPPVKAYAKGRDFSHIGADRAAGLYNPPRDCVRPFAEGLKARVGSLSSQPELIHEMYGYLRLENSTTARALVADVWEASISLEPLVDQIATCARENRPLHEVLCAWLDAPEIAAELLEPPSDPSNADGLRFALHEALLLERLAEAATKSRSFRAFLASHYASVSSEVEAALVRLSSAMGASETFQRLAVDKWSSIFTSAAEYSLMDLEAGQPSRAARQHQDLLALNIIEATDLDRRLAVTANADIGLALAAATGTAIPYVNSEQNVVFAFSKEWLDAYVAWSLNYVTTSASLHLLPKLLAPAIVCTSAAGVRNEWVISRSVTLKSTFLPYAFESHERKATTAVLRFPLDRRRESAAASAASTSCGRGSRATRWSCRSARTCCGRNTSRCTS